jgi:hypothetical protein
VRFGGEKGICARYLYFYTHTHSALTQTLSVRNRVFDTLRLQTLASNSIEYFYSIKTMVKSSLKVFVSVLNNISYCIIVRARSFTIVL